MYGADEADTATLRASLEAARENVEAAHVESNNQSSDDDDAPPPASPTADSRPTLEVVADKGYHKVQLLFELRRAEYRTYIPVPDQKGQRQFTDKGGMLAREAFHDNRSRVRRAKGKRLQRLRGERIERTFALACETGAHRRVRLRGRDNVRKRYLAHVAALNLGLVMRTLFGHGTPRQAADAVLVAIVVALRVTLKKILGFGEGFFGTLIPPATAHRRAADLAA
jgi:transposase